MSYHDQEAILAILAVEHTVVDAVDTVDVVRHCRTQNVSPLVEAMDRGLVTEEMVVRAAARELGLEFVDLFGTSGQLRGSVDVFDRVNTEWLETVPAVPLVDRANQVVVAAVDPQDPVLNDYLAMAFPEGYRCVLAMPSQVRQVLLTEASAAVAASFDDEPDEPPPPTGAQARTPVLQPTQRTPVLDWIDATLTSAVAQGASDLHFEITEEGRMLARFRVDGELVPQSMPLRGRELEVIAAVLSRAGMDSANLREPADGSFPFVAGGRRIDVRASMMPLITGPKLVLRLLDPQNLRSLDELGFGVDSLSLMRRATDLSQGLIVVAGPTGSGKTTTLYGMLREVASVQRNVMTIENPIEYRLPLVSQIPVRTDLGDRSVTFARALRTILRLDPDVILVGEVRDTETARVALDAALTGHLVLTTIHAPSAFGVFTRFIEMDIPPYLIAEAMTLSVSQRLVRKLHVCRRLERPDPALVQALSEVRMPVPNEVAVPVGCPSCGHRGYRGRIAVAELVAPDPSVRSGVVRRCGADELAQLGAASRGFVPYQTDLLQMLHTHQTSPTEVLRALTTGEL